MWPFSFRGCLPRINFGSINVHTVSVLLNYLHTAGGQAESIGESGVLGVARCDSGAKSGPVGCRDFGLKSYSLVALKSQTCGRQFLRGNKGRMARMNEPTLNELRLELKRFGVQNSFHGATRSMVQKLVARYNDHTGEAPPQLLIVEALRTARSTQYKKLLGKHTLEELGQHLPDDLWKQYDELGWLQFDLCLTKREQRMIALCHRVALCELGVDPTDTSTYAGSEHVLGYDSRSGWLRQPACSLAQFYLATHPTAYRLHVGLYARLLQRELKRGRLSECGDAATRDPVQCSVELALQMCVLPPKEHVA